MKANQTSNQKSIVITGASSGIGLACAVAQARTGARVIGVGRSEERCRLAEEKIRAEVPEAEIIFLLADLSSMDQVRQLAKDITKTLSDLGTNQLDVLVNNAGIYCDGYTHTPNGLEMTMAVNHFAPFLLTIELLPLLQASGDGRIITISSDSHFRTWLDIKKLNTPIFYHGLWAYKCSKLANVLFTTELNRRYRGTGIRAFAVDPGLVNTDIGFKGTGKFVNWVWQKRKNAGVPASVPARTVEMLATMPIERSPNDDYWYECKPKAASRQARNPDLARQLWEESIKLVSLDKKE